MADNPTISKITLPSGTTYDIKDAKARSDIASIEQAIAGGVTFMGETTTPLTDGSTTSTIVINGNNVTAVKGYLVVYSGAEFVYDGTKWIELGDLSALGNMAWVDTASSSYTPAGSVSTPTFTGSSSSVTITASDNTSGNYQPKGTVSQPTFSGNSLTSGGKFTPEGSVTVTTNATTNKTATVSPAGSGTATYTPAGSVEAPTISVSSAGSTTTVNSITAVGTLPSLTTTVTNENLTISFSQGTLPTKGSDTTVKTGDASYTASAPAFTGTGVRLVTGNIAVPNTYTASFTGTEGDVSVTGTPSGTVSQPTFTGTKAQLSGTTTAAGSVSQPTFTGTQATITVTPDTPSP